MKIYDKQYSLPGEGHPDFLPICKTLRLRYYNYLKRCPSNDGNTRKALEQFAIYNNQ